MREQTLHALLAVTIGAITAYMNVLLLPVIVLAVVAIIDYITGLTDAWMKKSLSSSIGFKGALKKVSYLFAVSVGIVTDYLINSALLQVGVDTQVSYCFGLIVTIWLIINELISILENLSSIGVPLPKFLIVIVNRLKNTVDNEIE